MSEIDHYPHRCLGQLHCPSDYPSLIVFGLRTTPVPISLYWLDANVKDQGTTWRAKKGDVLLGGGRGECPVLRVSIPEAIFFFTSDWDGFDDRSDLYTAFWMPDAAFALCNGFQKIGWVPGQDIETWLAERIVSYLLVEREAEFGAFRGNRPFPVYSGLFKPVRET